MNINQNTFNLKVRHVLIGIIVVIFGAFICMAIGIFIYNGGHFHNWENKVQYYEKPVYSTNIQCACGESFDYIPDWSEHVRTQDSANATSEHYSTTSQVQTGSEAAVVPGSEYKQCSICGAVKQIGN